jgi:hypothetical protein
MPLTKEELKKVVKKATKKYKRMLEHELSKVLNFSEII